MEKEVDENIRKIENIGINLDSYKIRNGLATLKNDICFFTPISQNEKYYYRKYDGDVYKTEKSICINVAKPNIIKSEKELDEKIQKAIFPYHIEGEKYSIIEEEVMERNYSYSYAFLSNVKDILKKRDKGKGKYPEWYAYGRAQGMLNFGKKLLLPYISDEPLAVLSFDPDILFYCGYAIFSDDEKELMILKKYWNLMFFGTIFQILASLILKDICLWQRITSKILAYLF